MFRLKRQPQQHQQQHEVQSVKVHHDADLEVVNRDEQRHDVEHDDLSGGEVVLRKELVIEHVLVMIMSVSYADAASAVADRHRGGSGGG